MRAAMCLSHLQLPRCQVNGSWWKKLNNLQNVSNLPLLRYDIRGLHGGGHDRRRWTRKSVSTDKQGSNVFSQQITGDVSHSNLNISGRVEIGECSRSVDIGQKISENKDTSSKYTTVIVFDTETTGFKRDNDRIIEIALQDLSGGVNSTFQTLVNPEMFVTNSYIHGISTDMVTETGVPRMKELIPILVRYVRSRQKPGGRTLFIGHNAKSFDVPFLICEFNRCSYEFPSDWDFMDSLSPARDLMKVKGSKLTSKSLQALREHYKIPLIGNAHRAMADVNVLALVLQKMTLDLKLTIPDLVEKYSFTAAELINNSKKKKNNSSR